MELGIIQAPALVKIEYGLGRMNEGTVLMQTDLATRSDGSIPTNHRKSRHSTPCRKSQR